jgi:hypothetical protein
MEAQNISVYPETTFLADSRTGFALSILVQTGLTLYPLTCLPTLHFLP